MRYHQFRDALVLALRDEGLLDDQLAPSESIDTVSMSRHWEAPIGGMARPVGPFHVTAMLSFTWDPVESARTWTCEEDLVTELLGDMDRLPDTTPRFLRTGLRLRASLQYGSRTPLPPAATWRALSRRVDARLEPVLPAEDSPSVGGTLLILGWRGAVEIEATCAADGSPCLGAVSVPSWRAVVPPRILDVDDPGEAPDAEGQLRELARSHGAAVAAWTECVRELGELVDHHPPEE